MQAAILRVKLPHLDRWNARRAEIARRYSERINHPRVSPALAGDANYVAHLYVLRALDRGSLSSSLRSRGVPHDIHYPIPDHWQPMNGKPSERVGLPITEILSREVLTLPCFPEMMDAEVDAIADAVNSWSH
jgi:dTDP-4-amino-4,6-dideoxygalactose transaminase